jgi:serpin B
MCRSFAYFTMLLVCTVGLSRLHAAETKPMPLSTNPSAAEVVASNEFAFDLYGELRRTKPSENLFYSPASITAALGIAYAGAGGETAEQIAKVMHLEGDAERVHMGMSRWLAYLESMASAKDFQLRVANRLWAQQGYKFLPDFLRITREQYGAELGQVDFQRQTEASRQSINRWVEQQTAGKIKDLLSPGAVDPRTRLVVTNAIYFKGDWQSPFKKERTEDGDFKLSAEQTARVPMMQQTNRFRFAQRAGFKVLQMPYRGGRLSMLIVLPDEVDGLAKLESELSASTWKEWTTELATKQVAIRLPRFQQTADFSLKDALSNLGMSLAFDPGAADFSRMDGKHDLSISAVLHKAFVDVSEEGTEAAAASGITFSVTSAAPQTMPEQFFADHPFLFAIVDNRTESVTFLGRLLDPRDSSGQH